MRLFFTTHLDANVTVLGSMNHDQAYAHSQLNKDADAFLEKYPLYIGSSLLLNEMKFKVVAKKSMRRGYKIIYLIKRNTLKDT